MEKVKIGDKDSSGQEEWWCEWFVCPSCMAGYDKSYPSGHIYHDFKFCPDCGVELEWEK